MTVDTELSERELEILSLVATGASNKEIAQQLVISPNTVKVHLRNIFAKIGASSRTEATLYAMRIGLVESPQSDALNGESTDAVVPFPVEGSGAAVPRTSRRPFELAAVGVLLIILVATAYLWATGRLSFGQPIPADGSDSVSRWVRRDGLAQPRSGMAVARDERSVYLIGGETVAGISADLLRYEPLTEQWMALAPKPLAVRDAQAAWLGGRIYVPGGSTASGQPMDQVDVYDPAADGWSQAAPLPQPLSAYALAAYEGRLYLFGGWDGQSFVDTTWIYDPRADEWHEGTPLLQPRGWAAAAPLAGQIHLIGGTDGDNVLATNQTYSPAREDEPGGPWEERSPLLDGRMKASAAVLADQIYLVGGEDEKGSQSLPTVQYQPQQDRWMEIEPALESAGVSLAAVPIDTYLHVIGGQMEDRLLNHHLVYQAVYTVLLPIVQD